MTYLQLHRSHSLYSDKPGRQKRRRCGTRLGRGVPNYAYIRCIGVVLLHTHMRAHTHTRTNLIDKMLWAIQFQKRLWRAVFSTTRHKFETDKPDKPAYYVVILLSAHPPSSLHR